jgi:hypothetical protein
MNFADLLLDHMPERLSTETSSHLHFEQDGWTHDYLVYPKDSKRLVVLLPGAMAKGKRFLPCFHRHSWASLIPANVICVSDPTLALHEDLLGGWFQGRSKDFVLERIVRHIETLSLMLGVPVGNVLFAGSSLGGWAAIAAATLLPGAVAYAENPQTDLRNYYSGPLALLDQHVFEGQLTQFTKDEPHRFSLLDLMRKSAYVPPLWITQKCSDEYHHVHHFRPFVSGMGSLGLARSHFVAEEIGVQVDSSGHSPLSSPQAIRRLEFIFSDWCGA